MAGFAITIDGDTAVAVGIDGLIARVEDMAPAWDEVGGSLVASTVDRFETESDPDGNPWPKSIRALAEGGQTLTLRGHLRDSVTHRADAASVEVGTNRVSARIHQLGGVIRPRTARALRFKVGGRWVTKQQVTIPARAFVGLSDADRTTVGAILTDWIAGGWS